jgi:hypothetical protein
MVGGDFYKTADLATARNKAFNGGSFLETRKMNNGEVDWIWRAILKGLSH